jgi:hypothetical protein
VAGRRFVRAAREGAGGAASQPVIAARWRHGLLAEHPDAATRLVVYEQEGWPT